MLPSTLRAGIRAPLSAFAAVAFRRDHTRCISRSSPASSPTNSLALTHDKEPELPVETDSVKPGHAVISTFDLFSIGGVYLPQYCPHDMINLISSWPKQFTYSRSYARR